MRIISSQDIIDLEINPQDCISWAEETLLNKYQSVLPEKVSLSHKNHFFNTMPCIIPSKDIFGIKVVTRYPEREPSIQGDILLYNRTDGKLLALMDGSWITMMRTGAVAALSIGHLKKKDAETCAIIGLGNTARATLLCLLSQYPNKKFEIMLYAYKGQEDLFINRFKDYTNLNFTVFDDVDSMFSQADIIISCITTADGLLAPDSVYKEGVLVVPVHTRGFQNCDLFFDKVYADDRNHVKNFRYFDKFKQFDEFSQVLLKNNIGRESDTERILAYNIGIALHDIYFAAMIYDKITSLDGGTSYTSLQGSQAKFWI